MRLGGSIRRRRGGPRTTRPEPEKRGRIPFFGKIVLVLVGSYAFGWVVATRLLFPAPPPPGDLYPVPDVRGETLERAAERVRESGLSLGAVSRVRHPEVDSGAVVGQAPLPGQLQRPEGSVRLTLSLGPEHRAVPDLVQLRADRAREVLEAAGFAVRADSVEDESPPGRVVDLEPEAGTELALPGEVVLTVSLGPPRVPMPLLLGMEQEQALDTLEALGLPVVEIEEVFRFGRDQGVVVEQSPPADSLVERGTEVRFSVGRRSGRGGG